METGLELGAHALSTEAGDAYAAALAVEGARGVLDRLGDDLLDLLVGDGRLGGERVDGAAVPDELEESSGARHGGAGL